jgi:hypothetical protein
VRTHFSSRISFSVLKLDGDVTMTQLATVASAKRSLLFSGRVCAANEIVLPVLCTLSSGRANSADGPSPVRTRVADF